MLESQGDFAFLRSHPLGPRPVALRGRLLRNLALLILVTSGAILFVHLRSASRAVDRLSRSLIERTTDRTRTELDRFFEPVRRNLLVARGWGLQGLLDPTDAPACNRLLAPVMERNPQVSSLLVSSVDGIEYMLLHGSDGWWNRQVRVEEWGRRTRWLHWRDLGAPAEESWRDLDYDPRRRPWFRAALAAADTSVPAWTAPYTFFTTRDPGITASVRWRVPGDGDGAGGEYVTAFDVMLLDISRFTTSLATGERGSAVVLTESGAVLGLPRSPRYAGPGSLRSAVLTDAERLGIPSLGDAMRAWRSRRNREPGLFRFDSEGEGWWAGFAPYPLDANQRLWIGVLVPEADLVGEQDQLRNAILLITLGALGVAFATSLRLARAIHRRMEAEVQRVRQIGQYTLEEKIGEGAMGTVYRASHAMLRRPTAVKLLRGGRANDERALERFENEVRMTSRLTHPNTIAVYDYGRTPEGVFYYAMEYLPGANLDTLVGRTGPLPPGRVILFLRQAADSLAEAHGIGLIHRDIKPANLMVCERGGRPDVLKVLDFGLVKNLGELKAQGAGQLTRDGVLTGTPLYMAPEAIREGRVDPRSDLYALGAVAWFLLAGRPVFLGANVVEVCALHLHERAPRPSECLGRELPGDLEDLVLACLEKEPDGRPASARELVERLDGCADAGSWTEEMARAWWSEHGWLLERRAEAPPARPTSLSVDLSRDGARAEARAPGGTAAPG